MVMSPITPSAVVQAVLTSWWWLHPRQLLITFTISVQVPSLTSLSGWHHQIVLPPTGHQCPTTKVLSMGQLYSRISDTRIWYGPIRILCRMGHTLICTIMAHLHHPTMNRVDIILPYNPVHINNLNKNCVSYCFFSSSIIGFANTKHISTLFSLTALLNDP